MKTVFIWCVSLWMISISFSVCSQEEYDSETEFTGQYLGEVKEYEFREDLIKLPGYPEKDKLMKVDIDAGLGVFEFFIDPDSISIGRDDVVSATMVIRSSQGANNILFDAYRCDTREYKTVAYGTSSDKFYQIHDPQWKAIKRSRSAALDFRREMVTIYLCDIHRLPLEKEEILQLVKYPNDREDSGRMF